MTNTPLEKRKFKEVPAKKAKECRLCPNTWKEGEMVFIMSDPFNDSFEIICRECRERVAAKVTNNSPTITVEAPKNDNLKFIHAELKKVLARLEKLMETSEDVDDYSDC